MTMYELMELLKTKFREYLKTNDLLEQNITITAKALTPKEAIGVTKRQDYPILTGKESMLQAEFMTGVGQAFTDSPASFGGTLEEILAMDLEQDTHAKGPFIAALNAVMSHIGEVENTVHCKNDGPELCAKSMMSYLQEHAANKKITMIGYQPALLEELSKEFTLRVLDLNPENVGKQKYGAMVEDGIKAYDDAVLNWADLILCTGSTICNGSIVNFLNLEKEVLFFGTTIAGAAKILGLKRVCFPE